jgi:hypothetical protein
MNKKINITHVPKELLFIGMKVNWIEAYCIDAVGNIVSILPNTIGIKWTDCSEPYFYGIDNSCLYIIFDKCKKLQKIYDYYD